MDDETTQSSSNAIAAPGCDATLAVDAHALRMRLPLKRQRFIEEYLLSANGADAARKAGYSGRRANRAAQIILANPHVQEALLAARAELARHASYTVERCMAELEKGMTFALTTENASAYVRAVELRGKLSGILVDKLDARLLIGSFHIVVEGLDRG